MYMQIPFHLMERKIIILQALFKIVKVVLPNILDTVNVLMPLEERTVIFAFGVRPG